MKTLGTLIVLSLCGLIIFAVLCLVQACGAPPPPTTVAQTFSDAQGCVVGILATSTETPDVQDLLKCGMTATDLHALVTSLLKQAQGGDAGAKGAALSPSQAAWILKLETVKTNLEAQGVK